MPPNAAPPTPDIWPPPPPPVQLSHCPNCGAPVEPDDSGRCHFCDAMVSRPRRPFPVVPPVSRQTTMLAIAAGVVLALFLAGANAYSRASSTHYSQTTPTSAFGQPTTTRATKHRQFDADATVTGAVDGHAVGYMAPNPGRFVCPQDASNVTGFHFHTRDNELSSLFIDASLYWGKQGPGTYSLHEMSLSIKTHQPNVREYMASDDTTATLTIDKNGGIVLEFADMISQGGETLSGTIDADC